MLTSLELLPMNEVTRRIERCRQFLARMEPEAGGMLICSRPNVYYLTGTLGYGLVWIPLEGEPVLMLRKGIERARVESPFRHVLSFKSYKDLAPLCAEAGSPFSSCIAVDKNGFNWSMADMLQSRMKGITFVSCDNALAHAKAVKSEWELNKLRICGERHRKALDEVLPSRIRPGMTELEIAQIYAAVVFECGGSGLIRMNAHGEENIVGYVSAGESGNYPTSYNGPLGSRGQHPAVPFLGDAGTVWKPGMLLSGDLGFSVEGYTTDKTQTYWAGSASSISDTIQRAHDVCVRIYEHAVESLKPGAIPATIWQDALHIAVQAGYKDEFMGCSADRVPFLGHGVGLAMDEFPVFANGFTEPLEEGMVVAIEPKIGLPGVAMVGLEHTLEITATGARSLTGETRNIIVVE